MLKLKLQYFGHLMGRVYSLEKTLMLGKIEGREWRGRQRMRWLDGITDSVYMGLGGLQEWWWTVRPGMLWFMGSQRVRHDWVTKLNWSVVISLELWLWKWMKRHFWGLAEWIENELIEIGRMILQAQYQRSWGYWPLELGMADWGSIESLFELVGPSSILPIMIASQNYISIVPVTLSKY